MDTCSCDQSPCLTIVGYYNSGVQYLYKLILQLTKKHSTFMTRGNAQTIVCCEGELPTGNCHTETSHKTVFIVRNPKDIAVALYKNSGAEHTAVFCDFAYNFIFKESGTTWCEYTRRWETALNKMSSSSFHVVYFDDLIQNLEAEISRLCQFFNITENLTQISEISSLLLKDLDQPQRKRRKTDSSVNGYSKEFYEVGIWKDYFTVHLQEQFDEAVASALKDSKLELSKLLH